MSKHGAMAPPIFDQTAASGQGDPLGRLDLSTTDLEQRLAQAHQAELRLTQRRDGTDRPSLATPRETPPPPAPAETSGFLAELEREAAGRQQGDTTLHDRRARAQRLHETLGRIFGFFNLLARHANDLGPAITRSYRLDAQTAYTGLRWHGAFADYRKQSVAENAPLSHVTFRVKLVAPESVAVVRRWDQLEAFLQELHILNLRTVEEIDVAKKPQQELFQLHLAPEFPVQISFQGNYEADRIDILSRNLEGFGIAAFTVDTTQVTQPLLDDLGRFLLCRSANLPAALRRVHYRPKQ